MSDEASELEIILAGERELTREERTALNELNRLLGKLLELEALFTSAGLRATTSEEPLGVVTREVQRRPAGQILWSLDYRDDIRGKVWVWIWVFGSNSEVSKWGKPSKRSDLELWFDYFEGLWQVKVDSPDSPISDEDTRLVALSRLVAEHSIRNGRISEPQVMNFLYEAAKIFVPEARPRDTDLADVLRS